MEGTTEEETGVEEEEAEKTDGFQEMPQTPLDSPDDEPGGGSPTEIHDKDHVPRKGKRIRTSARDTLVDRVYVTMIAVTAARSKES
jgi:hypothetical protein